MSIKIEIVSADCIAPPGHSKLQLNSNALWMNMNGKWYKLYDKSIHKARAKILECLEAEEWPECENVKQYKCNQCNDTGTMGERETCIFCDGEDLK